MVERAVRLVESVAASATVVGRPEAFRYLQAHAIADDWPGAGPLGGIATALRASESPWSLIVACDLPYLRRDWLEFLVERAAGVAANAEAVMAMSERGAEPLCAMYHKRCAPAIRMALERGTRKVTDGLAGLRVAEIGREEWKAFDSHGLLFKNMNSPEDYEEARRTIENAAGQNQKMRTGSRRGRREA